jgi:hypothetical protein
MSSPCHCQYHYIADLDDEEPCASTVPQKLSNDIFDLLADLFAAEPGDDLPFIALAGYLIKTPASRDFLAEHQAIALWLRTHTDTLMNSRPHLLSICFDLSSFLSHV